MPLIRRIRDHTVRGFRKAARLRFEEAKRSAIAGDRLIGIYLCGYAAEMILKVAYFRLEGRTATGSITIFELRLAQKYAHALKVQWAGNLHSLPGWAGLLTAEREKRRNPYPTGFASSLESPRDLTS